MDNGLLTMDNSTLPDPSNEDAILDIKDLVVHYVLEEETVEAVNGVTFSLKKSQTLACHMIGPDRNDLKLTMNT